MLEQFTAKMKSCAVRDKRKTRGYVALEPRNIYIVHALLYHGLRRRGVLSGHVKAGEGGFLSQSLVQ